jgi:hypothetical protein
MDGEEHSGRTLVKQRADRAWEGVEAGRLRDVERLGLGASVTHV